MHRTSNDSLLSFSITRMDGLLSASSIKRSRNCPAVIALPAALVGKHTPAANSEQQVERPSCPEKGEPFGEKVIESVGGSIGVD
jgi:hypothetical protein